jgi:hypothetical protein
MSTIQANLIEPSSGTTVTFGASGDTVTIPSGATIDASAGTATGFGKVLQVLQVAVTATTSYGTDDVWADISGMTLDITPSSTSSTILINTSANYGASDPANTYCRLMRDSTPIAIGATAGSRILCTYEIGVRHTHDVYESWPQSFMYLDSPSTTSATTYKMQWYIEDSSATLYLNQSSADGDNTSYSRNVSTIILMEIGA